MNGLSQREVAKQLKVSRNTVKRYVKGAPVGVRRPSIRERPKSEAVEARMPEDSPRPTAEQGTSCNELTVEVAHYRIAGRVAQHSHAV